MKRFFVLFLAVLVCLSFCVNIAFASDVVTARVDQNILVYFPWFGGVSGSSASRVTNYATVTTSDVSVVGTSVLDQVFNGTIGYSWPSGSYIRGNGSKIEYYSGVSGNFGNASVNVADISVVSGHKYLVLVDNSNATGLTRFLLYNRASGGTVYADISSTGIYDNLGTGVINVQVTGNDQFGGYTLLNIIDLTDMYGAGNEATSVDEVLTYINNNGYSFPVAPGSYTLNPISSFSLVPAPAANGGSSSHQTNDYTWYQYEADISLSGENVLNQDISDWLVDNTNYSYWYSYVESAGKKYQFNWYYGTQDFASSLFPSGVTVSYVPDTLLSNMNIAQITNYVHVQVDPDKLPLSLTNNGTALGAYTDVRVNVAQLLDIIYDIQEPSIIQSVTLSDPTDFLYSDRVFGDGVSNYDGTFTIDRIFRLNDNSYFLFNNQVNLGTYDFNVNVKFPSLDKFNSFSGYWMASFNTSWGEIPVRTEIQEVSSNSDTLIKIYKLTFDVPFTGQYTKFNIKYVGDSSAFTTIRVDASVIDPNGYQNGAGPTTINGLSFYLTSMFDKFWGKIRSLFFDNDQTMAESVPAEAGELAGEVSSGAQSIHEFETNNFDSIETQQEQVDWDIPTDFGDISDSSSAIGFVSMLFMGVYQSLGVKVQYVIVVPLILGLVLLVLGRGSMALGKLVDSMKR